MKPCAIEGCERPKRKRGRYCSMHTARIARHGDPHVNKHDGSARHISSAGYVVLNRSGHPLASEVKNGRLYEHRVVLYDTIGPGGHACHWCGNIVAWGGDGLRMLVVDHLDSVRSNNHPDNLVPSCGPCNTRRGFVQGTRHSRAAITRGAS